MTGSVLDGLLAALLAQEAVASTALDRDPRAEVYVIEEYGT